MIFGMILIVLGLGMSALGLHLSDEREGAAAVFLSLLAPVGVGLAVVGALIVFVPTFFDPIPETVGLP